MSHNHKRHINYLTLKEIMVTSYKMTQDPGITDKMLLPNAPYRNHRLAIGRYTAPNHRASFTGTFTALRNVTTNSLDFPKRRLHFFELFSRP